MTQIHSFPPEASNPTAQRITVFVERFGQAHLYLAYHAALPLALTPDLLYRIWATFPQDIHGTTLNIPWIAVADLLLSNLCEEVGHELYEMDRDVRTELLTQLQQHSQFGQVRVQELSNFLITYVRSQLDSPDLDRRDFAQAQTWVVLAHTQPESAAREIASTLAGLDIENRPEWLRLTSLVETLKDPLAEHQPLLIYAQSLQQFTKGEIKIAKKQIYKILDKDNQVQVAGVNLSIPKHLQIKRYSRKVRQLLIVGSTALLILSAGGVTWYQIDPSGFQHLWNQIIGQKPLEKTTELLWIQTRTFVGHTNTVTSVSFSHDGKTIVSGSADRTIKLWSIDGKELTTLKGHTDTVTSVSFSPDGKTIVSGSADRTIKLWSIDGKLLRTFVGHSDTVTSVSFSPDGKTFASGSYDRTTKLWSIDGKLLRTFVGHSDIVTSVSFSPDGQSFASGSADKTVKTGSIAGEPPITLTGHTDTVTSVSFSPDGKTIASGSADKTVELWSQYGQELQTLQLPDSVNSIAFSPDNQNLEAAAGNNIFLLQRANVANLISALKSSDLSTRRTAASALGSLGTKAKEAIPALTEALKDSDPIVRQNAADALQKIRGTDPNTLEIKNQALLDQATQLTNGSSQASEASDLRRAISLVQQIQPDQPLYDQAQQQITRWSQIILDIAQQRANQGDFERAIAAAKLVPSAPPHKASTGKAESRAQQSQIFNQAQGLIKNWQISLQPPPPPSSPSAVFQPFPQTAPSAASSPPPSPKPSSNSGSLFRTPTLTDPLKNRGAASR